MPPPWHRAGARRQEMHWSSFSCLIILAIGTFRAGAGDDEKGKRLSAGGWGGQGIRMEASEAGASIDYDCAHGSIDQPPSLDPAGPFDWKGPHFRQHGGPVREGAEPKGEPARYI